MRWQGGRQSENVEDRRGARPKVAVAGGLGTLVLILLALVLGIDPRPFLNPRGAGGPAPIGANGGDNAVVAADPAEEERVAFVKVILADTEDVWSDLFADQGRRYEDPVLVLFRDQVASACGVAGSATGPFYCPGDRKVYLDLAFFDDLARDYGAPGEFAQAYVIANEVGHHVQNLMGTLSRVEAVRRRASEAESNQSQLRLELQADDYAGVWAHHAQKARNLLQRGDVEASIRAAQAVGDDTLQNNAQGYAVPDSFTHGTSVQRARWFRKGFETGDLEAGDTFSIPYDRL